MYFIHEYKQRLRQWLADDLVFTGVVVVLVAAASFGLGRWSLESTETPTRPVLVPTSVEAPTQTAAAVTADTADTEETTASGSYVASVNGTKYHALDCPGAKQINDGNKIFFTSIDQARAAGYTPAANCSFE